MPPEIHYNGLQSNVKILVVEDETSFLRSIVIYLERRGLNVTGMSDPIKALALLDEQVFDILVTDIKMPGMNGITLGQKARDRYPQINIILMTAYGTMQEAVDAVKLHAFDFLIKPVELQHLHHVIGKIVSEKAILRENLLLKKELHARGYMGDFVGISRAVQDIYETIHKINEMDTPVSIEGESGTGKGLLARTIHKFSPRKNEPFVEVNLGAIVPQLMESELFGHVKGAFTGAIRDNLGIVLSAHRGTLFLDEIAEIAPDLQVKLLHLLQNRSVRPVGGKKEIPADVRIITATNRPLQEAVESGLLREDFYYRIRVLPIVIPPLRKRREDIPVIVGHVLQRLEAEGKSSVKAITPEAMDVFLSYPWPGNVRELENLLERCAAISVAAEEIGIHDLPQDLMQASHSAPAEAAPLDLQELEIKAIQRALSKTAGNKKQAAQLLGIDKSTLHRKIRRYHIKGPLSE